MRTFLAIGVALAALVLPAGAWPEEGKGPGENTGAGVLDRFTPEQRAKLLAGEAVYELVEHQEGGETRGHGMASVLINAPVEDCWKIFTQYDRQHLYFPRKTKSEVVKREDNVSWVHKAFDFYVTTVQYTVIYTEDPALHRVDFQMDPAFPHDIKDTAGYFQFRAYNENQTLFNYAATKVETGLKVPKMIQEYLASRDLPDVVLNVKKRVESGGAWTKEK